MKPLIHTYISRWIKDSRAQTTKRRFTSSGDSGEDSFVSLLNMIDTHSTLIYSTKQIIKKKKKKLKVFWQVWASFDLIYNVGVCYKLHRNLCEEEGFD